MNSNFNSYQFLDNVHQNQFKMQLAQQPKLETANFKVHTFNDNFSGFALPNQKIPLSMPASVNNAKAPPNISTHQMHPSKSSRSFRDSVDSDVMSSHTQSSDDSISCPPESKETYSSQFNNFNTANSVSSNVSIFSKEKEDEEATASLLCCSYPPIHLNLTGSSQPNPSNQQPQLNIAMTSQQILEACNVPITTKIISSITSDDGYPPLPPEAPYPPFDSNNLNPPTPCCSVGKAVLPFPVHKLCRITYVGAIGNSCIYYLPVYYFCFLFRLTTKKMHSPLICKTFALEIRLPSYEVLHILLN